MDSFDILESPDKTYQKIVVGKSYESPSDYLSEISYLLSKEGVIGRVIFDYFLTGETKSRFFELEFDGKTFIYNSLKSIEASETVLDAISSFYRSNYRCIENSLLSEPVKFQYKYADVSAAKV